MCPPLGHDQTKIPWSRANRVNIKADSKMEYHLDQNVLKIVQNSCPMARETLKILGKPGD